MCIYELIYVRMSVSGTLNSFQIGTDLEKVQKQVKTKEHRNNGEIERQEDYPTSAACQGDSTSAVLSCRCRVVFLFFVLTIFL